MEPAKKKKKNHNLLKSRSMAEKPIDATKGGGDNKSSDNCKFTYCLIFHYHTTASLPTTTISPKFNQGNSKVSHNKHA